MTELQMGLIGLGVIAVVGVLAYNKWQEMLQRGQAERLLKASHPDVLLDGAADKTQAREPEARFSPAVDEAGTGDARVEPVLGSRPEQESPEPAEPAASAPAPAEAAGGREPEEDQRFLSPLIDFIASIDAVEAVPARHIVDTPREALARVRKPVRWIGYDEASGEWLPISPQPSGPQGKYRHIRAGLQLVNRQGPVSEDELVVFATAMQELADQLTGVASLPSRQSALETAWALDQFCVGVDIQIGINVISQGRSFVGTKLRALAESAGMVIDEGRFVYRDNGDNLLFALLNQEASGFSAETMRSMSTQGLTFLLDVPCVTQGRRVFDQMVELARHFADVLRGALVDDNRHPLSDASLEPVRQQIDQYQAMLAARQLPAGSPLARRLFS
ncbi:MAG: cell division protein FtsZ [Candidatus Accumulibacter sp.]|jgi:FtsZ-interacting cell division protein ZipA|nr:cell division protein FtsZ [Accumulibacter sp.]